MCDHPYCNAPHAFTSGFDQEGAEGLKGKLVGRKEWIGTAGMIVYKSFRLWLMYACARTICGIHVQRDPVCYILNKTTSVLLCPQISTCRFQYPSWE